MPIKIHHGPPGSYKTAGAMGDDFLREARAGRVIVTNVRGVTRDRVLAEFPDLPDSFDVIWVDDKTQEGRTKWATWFHWVPQGAFIFVNEIQDIWPKTWKEADIRRLDYPGGVEQAAADNRPPTWEVAFEKHRHFNWDMVLTTPSYRKVRDDVKQCAEMAYKHKNLATVGIRGRYIEAAHLADDDGGSASHFLNVQTKKVPAYVFRIYDSTATGKVTDTKVGFSIFSNPRIVILLGVLALCLLFVFKSAASGSLSIIGIGDKPAAAGGGKPAPSPAPAGGGVSPGVAPGLPAPSASGVRDPLSWADAQIVASLRTPQGWRYVVQRDGALFTSAALLDLGAVVVPRGQCALLLKLDGHEKLIPCRVTVTQNEGA